MDTDPVDSGTVVNGTVKTPLGRDVLIDRALELADSEGLAAVTIRRLAQELEVTPMALYWHFRKKDDLLAGLGERLLEQIEVPEPGPASWSEQLRDILEAVVASMRAHPAAAPLVAAQILSCEVGLMLTERTLEVLASGGFSVEEAANVAHRALQSMIILVTSAPGAEVGFTSEQLEAHQRAKRVALASLSPDRYPRLVAAAEVLTSCDDEDAYYGFGVDLLVAGALQFSQTRSAVL